MRSLFPYLLFLPIFFLGSMHTPQLCGGEPAKFHPSQLSDIIMFVESIRGMEVTTSNAPEIYNLNTELVPLEKCWSDQERFPHGTVRWWLDQSGYQRAPLQLKRKPYNPHKTGRDFGQDDHDRPGFIPDGCHGKPCARGGLIPPKDDSLPADAQHRKQPCYFEIQYGQGYSADTPFSIFLLAKPIEQKNNFVYYGVAHWSNLFQDVQDRALIFKNGANNSQKITGPNAVAWNKWQLIEIHRDDHDRVTVFVNGKDMTRGDRVFDGELRVGFLMNNNKGQKVVPEPMAGDIAAYLATSRNLSEEERKSVRNYLDGVYRFLPRK